VEPAHAENEGKWCSVERIRDIDLADDALQQAVLAEQFTLFWTTPEIVGVTLWGYIHGATWRPDTGVLRNDTSRPALTWLLDYLGRRGTLHAAWHVACSNMARTLLVRSTPYVEKSP
jgi:hypothetical protein